MTPEEQEINDTLRKLVASVIRDSGLSVSEVSRRTNRSISGIRAWLNATTASSISAVALAQMLAVCGTDLAELIEQEQPLTPQMRAFLNRPLAQKALQPNERRALIALDRCGYFQVSTPDQIENAWARIAIENENVDIAKP